MPDDRDMRLIESLTTREKFDVLRDLQLATYAVLLLESIEHDFDRLARREDAVIDAATDYARKVWQGRWT